MATTLNWTIILLQIMISQKKEKKIALFFFGLNCYMIIMDSNNISYGDNYYNIYL